MRRNNSQVALLRDKATKTQVIIENKKENLKSRFEKLKRTLINNGQNQDAIVLEQFLQLSEIEAANHASLAILNWVLGEGVSKSRYERYFTEQDDSEFERDNKSNKFVRLIDNNLNEESEIYNLDKLLESDYTTKTIWKFLYFYQEIESRRWERDHYEDIYIDLSSSIKRLAEDEQIHILHIAKHIKVRSKKENAARIKAVTNLLNIILE